MGIRHGHFAVSRSIIALSVCFGCSASHSTAVMDGGKDWGPSGNADAIPDADRGPDARDVAPSPDRTGPDLASLDWAGVESAQDALAGDGATAADVLDAALDGGSIDRASIDQSGVATDLGGVDSAGEAGSTTMADPFAGVTLKPDTETAPVASCTGQPDMTLCNVVTSPDRWYDICVGGTCVSPGCGDPSCNAPAPHFPIPANSDHSHLQIVSSSSEPIVADLVTGLHWQGCDAGRSGDGCTTGTSTRLGWQDAVAYCDALSWGGKEDWYLPDSYELMSIVDWAKSGDTGVRIDPAVFPHSSYAYWSSHVAASSRTFGIQFRLMDPIILTNGPYYVRCVRRGFSRNAAYVGSRFVSSTIESQKVITDPATGLVWQGRHSAVLPRAEWVEHCESLSWGGSSDWQLPTYKELYSIAQLRPFVSGWDPEIDDKVFDVSSRYAVGTRSGWQDNAARFLYEVADASIAFLDLTPTYTFPVICVRRP